MHVSCLDVIEKMAELSEPAAASLLWLRALGIREKVNGDESSNLCDPLHNLAQLALQAGEHAKALRYLVRLAAIATKSFGPDHPLTREAVEKRDNLRESARR